MSAPIHELPLDTTGVTNDATTAVDHLASSSSHSSSVNSYATIRNRKSLGGGLKVKELTDDDDDDMNASQTPDPLSSFETPTSTAAADPYNSLVASQSHSVHSSQTSTAEVSPSTSTSSDIAASSLTPHAILTSPQAALPVTPAAAVGRRRAAVDEDHTSEVALFFLFVFMLLGGFTMYLLSDTGVFFDAQRLGLRGGRKMRDTEFKLMVSLEAVNSGATVQSEFPGGRQIVCPYCGGTGGHGHDGVSQCSTCSGSGVLQTQRMVAPGFYQNLQQTCPKCGGRGSLIHHPCRHCGGEGLLRDHTTPLNITLPRGMPEGWIVTLPGQGDQPHVRDKYVASGDVHITVVTRPHRFERHGQDLHLTYPLTLRQALLGVSDDLILLDGTTHRLERHDAPIQPGERMRIPGKGLPSFDAQEARQSAALQYEPRWKQWIWRYLKLPFESAMRALLRRRSSTNVNDILPQGDLVIQFEVKFPKERTFNLKEKEELRKLLHPT